VKGPFDGFEENRDAMMNVLRMHRALLNDVDGALCPAALRKAAEQAWERVVEDGARADCATRR